MVAWGNIMIKLEFIHKEGVLKYLQLLCDEPETAWAFTTVRISASCGPYSGGYSEDRSDPHYYTFTLIDEAQVDNLLATLKEVAKHESLFAFTSPVTPLAHLTKQN